MQYVMGKKDASVTIKAHIPDSARWSRGKPTPSDLATFASSGIVQDIATTDDKVLSHVDIAVNAIAFIGRSQSTVIQSTPSRESHFLR